MAIRRNGVERWLCAAAAVAVIVAFAWAWGSSPINLRERIYPKNLAEVESGWLYRSGQIKPNLIERTLRNLDIDVIVDLTQDLGTSDPSQVAQSEAAAKLGIETERYPMYGTGVARSRTTSEPSARSRRPARRANACWCTAVRAIGAPAACWPPIGCS
jgi:hypothetical protein